MPRYFWPWNAPRQAIASPYPTWAEMQQHSRRMAAVSQAWTALAQQPALVQRAIRQRHARLESQRGAASAASYLTTTFAGRLLPRIERVSAQYRLGAMRRGTAAWLSGQAEQERGAAAAAGTLWELMRRFNQLPDMSRADVDMLAGDIASFIFAELVQLHAQNSGESDWRYSHRLYLTAATITREFRQTPPLWQTVTTRLFAPEDVTPAIMRMQAETWWKGRLRRIAAEWREHVQIALIHVSKNNSPYASRAALAEWREQKRRTRDFLQSMELEDEEGNRISLIDKHDGSVANPAIRRCELMTRIRGFETICNEMGYVGEFCTLTAPARYHATLSSGQPNPKWDGASPAETQRYLCRLWQKVRARLHREQIRLFGIRVAEPHHDGTPHWHLLLFMRPQQAARVRQILTEYACQQDSEELTSEKARKARFHTTAIDPQKGSATGYIAKYIAKNIDGYALDGEQDHESGANLRDCAAAVSAWAGRWHIRQFQFVGGAPVTVWRELRRLTEAQEARKLSRELTEAREAADNGDWAAYINAQGGPFVRRDELAVRIWYQDAEECNRWGEEITRIKGVYLPDAGKEKPLLTRLVAWKVVPKRKAEAEEAKQSAASWSSVINCTPLTEAQPAGSPGVLARLTHCVDRLAKKNAKALFQGHSHRQNAPP
ncbi:replication endonuclease [Candidatus Pantoea deserta]|uniref:Replication endonuclease n=1 Tax=Candidatus Pantoea deserta TaxID=1869313 RepID=A0A3N4NS88_9GAMM|nr:replication endonuclease [Pantoea deserta]RPD99191.1 replication endonuclease [Pantoea deserta]